MPCWPDVWESAKNLLPMLGIIALVATYIALVVLLLWAPKLRKRWVRIASRILGVAGIVPAVIVFPAVFFGFLLASGNPPAQTRVVTSSKGQQAKLIYQAGFLGRDYTEVRLKRADCCKHSTVFWHNGPSWFNDPKLEWLDDRHLRIDYHTRTSDRQHCESQVGDVYIVCKSQLWPETPNAQGPAKTQPSAK